MVAEVVMGLFPATPGERVNKKTEGLNDVGETIKDANGRTGVEDSATIPRVEDRALIEVVRLSRLSVASGPTAGSVRLRPPKVRVSPREGPN
jgi:hypothetical protein